MREYKIYTCRKMSGISFSEQMQWGQILESFVRNMYDGNDIIKFIHPPLFYNYKDIAHKTEKEILDWEIMQLHNCDIVVVDLEKINTTVGTHMELGAVQGINRFSDKYIFVVGIGNTENVHPWILESCNRIESNYADASKYIVNYLLI